MDDGSFFLHAYARFFGLLIPLPLWEGTGLLAGRLLLPALFAASLVNSGYSGTSYCPSVLLLEVLVGCCLSLPIVLLIEAASFAGSLLDSARGSSMAALYSPTATMPESIVAVIVRRLFFLLFLLAGMFEQLFILVAESFEQLPISQIKNWQVLEVVSVVIETFITIFTLALSILLPVLLLFLFVEMALASIQFFIPGFQMHSESFLIKSLLAIFLAFALVSLDAWQDLTPWMLATLRENARHSLIY